MSILWLDGFDWTASAVNQSITTPLTLKYSFVQNSWTSANPRISGSGVSIRGNDGGSVITTPNWSAVSTIVVGFGHYRQSTNFYKLFYVQSGVNSQMYMAVNASGCLEVRQTNDNIIATGTTQMTPSQWNYVELKITINSSTGSVTSKINNVADLSATGLNNQAQSDSNITAISFQLLNQSWCMDDLYILNTAGSINNDFIGDVQVQALFPTGAGTYTDFTPLSGSNYANVDEVPADGDTSYNTGVNNGDKDTYAFADISGSATVKAVDINLVARKAAAGARTYAVTSHINGSDYDGNNVAALDSYIVTNQIYEQNPDTSAAWLVADVNAAEFGIKITN